MSLELVTFDEQLVLAGDIFSLGAVAQLEEVREALEPLVDAAPASLAAGLALLTGVGGDRRIDGLRQARDHEGVQELENGLLDLRLAEVGLGTALSSEVPVRAADVVRPRAIRALAPALAVEEAAAGVAMRGILGKPANLCRAMFFLVVDQPHVPAARASLSTRIPSK